MAVKTVVTMAKTVVVVVKRAVLVLAMTASKLTERRESSPGFAGTTAAHRHPPTPQD